ncbi:RelA/SpoT family protein [Gammaproteobacteria bacterium]|nr:RelA/SpoT family protein [Gammaproteobacteria bacterium]
MAKISTIPILKNSSSEHVIDWLKQAREWVADEQQRRPSQTVDDDEHALREAVLEILQTLGLDSATLAFGWLGATAYRWYSSLDPDACRPLATLANHHEKLSNVWARSDAPLEGDAHADSVENLRRMLLAMVDDPRIVMLVLAEQLARLRIARHDADELCRQQLARRTLDIYAPLANRLGIWHIKWELEDWSLRYLQPKHYHDIAAQLSAKRGERIDSINALIASLNQQLHAEGIDAEINGRPKHIYSIWKKMLQKDVGFERILDINALRVICDNVSQCYASLGVVHGLWPPLMGEFVDYIATPKANGYQSIHTVVYGPQGKVVEVQIRTAEMHQLNELGVAAHWRYKEARGDSSGSIDNKILWLRELLKWQDEQLANSGLIDEFRAQTDDERVYVFSPRGEVYDLPLGATAIDFAYTVHTEVGHSCRGARANGRIITLDHRLSTGDQVEILTQRGGGPSRDWLDASGRYVVTPRARMRIQRWFREQEFEQNVVVGRHLLEKEAQRLSLRLPGLESLIRATRYTSADAFLEAIGVGELKPMQALAPIRDRQREESRSPVARRQAPKPKQTLPIVVDGVDNLVMRLAGCCQPVLGDPLVAYVAASGGVSIHRTDCENIERLAQAEQIRLLPASWEDDAGAQSVQLRVVADARDALLGDVSQIVADSDLGLEGIDYTIDRRQQFASVIIRLQIPNQQALHSLIARLSAVSGVIRCERIKR